MHTTHTAGRAPATRDRFLRLDEVQAVTGLGKSTIYQLMKAGEFPKSIRLHARMVGWPESAIQKWIQERITASEQT